MTEKTQATTNALNKQDIVWMLSLYGTAVGAGTLFLPINAGLQGIWPLIIMLLLAFPMTYFSHRAFCRLVLSGSEKNNITQVVEEHFGKFASKLITLFYFCAIYPILLIYSVAITNTTETFIVHQLGVTPPPRALLAFILVAGLMTLLRFGQHVVIKTMSILVYPFITILLLLAIYLIPHWNLALFNQSSNISTSSSLLLTLWLIIPVMVFSFNHSPIISSFAVRQKERYGLQADEKCSRILKLSHILMVFTVMFFVFSCVLSLTASDLAQAKEQNISILSYLANHFQTPILANIAPLLAFIAIAKSFFGHYLGAHEGIYGLTTQLLATRQVTIKPKVLYNLSDLFFLGSCWLAATLNPSILGMIEMLCGPIIALLLFLMPMYAIMKVPAMQKYRHLLLSNTFTIIMGLIAFSGIIYKLIF